MIIKSSIPARYVDEYHDFYHHAYIPNILEEFPEVLSARRYEEGNTSGSLRYYHKTYLTLYELEPRACIDSIYQRLIERKKDSSVGKKMQQFISKMSLHEPAEIYTCRYEHPRRIGKGEPFVNHALFCVSVEVQPKYLHKFNDWYENTYLVKNLADVPTWSACRRYTSVKKNPPRQITFYETADEASLMRSLELMRAKSRVAENESWQDWDGGNNPPITWEDACSYLPIFWLER